MTMKSILLSSTGLKNIVIKEKDEFTFVICNHELHMSNIFAEFLSPFVSYLHHSDPTINTIRIDYDQNSTNNKIGELFTEETIFHLQELARGSKVEISEEESRKMRIISILLNNEELYQAINTIYPQEINSNNINETIDMYEQITRITTNYEYFYFKDIIELIASNFCSIDQEKIKKLPPKIFYSIISSPKLKVESEDSLIDIIDEIIEEPQDIIPFYETIKLNNLSDEKFYKFLTKLNPNEITGPLWRSICERFYNKGKMNKAEDLRYSEPKVELLEFDGNESHKLSGIINFLTNQNGGNVHDKGIVEVTASSEQQNDNRRKAKFLVEFNDTQKFFRTGKKENDSWVQYNFKERKVRPTQYSIQSKPYGPGDLHPQHWVIEGSNNGKDWKVLDTRTGIQSLNAKSVICTFKIEQELKKDEYYQFLRLRQTGLNANGDYHLGLGSLEFFGTITKI